MHGVEKKRKAILMRTLALIILTFQNQISYESQLHCSLHMHWAEKLSLKKACISTLFWNCWQWCTQKQAQLPEKIYALVKSVLMLAVFRFLELVTGILFVLFFKTVPVFNVKKVHEISSTYSRVTLCYCGPEMRFIWCQLCFIRRALQCTLYRPYLNSW